jgi:hypothetical protein
MCRHKMEKQTSNINNVKMPMLPELSNDNKRSQPLPQVQAYNRLPDRSLPMPDRSMATPDRSIPMPDKLVLTLGNKHLWHQPPHSSDARMIHLVPTDCICETSLGTSSVTDSKFTTHHKATWEPLLPP